MPKFKHYQPRTAVLTSVEFDHADIYDDLAQVEAAFDLLSELVAKHKGTLIPCATDSGAMATADRAPAGLEIRPYGGYPGPELRGLKASDDGYHVSLWQGHEPIGDLLIPVYGRHNVANALAAYEVCRNLGVDHGTLAEGLRTFAGVKRRMELRARPNDILIFDDFAHHPTAVTTTLAGVRERHPDQRIFAVFEPRSATSCRRVFQQPYTEAFDAADRVWIAANARAAELPVDERFLPEDLVLGLKKRGVDAEFGSTVQSIVDQVAQSAKPGDLVVIMSNGAFGGIHERLVDAVLRR